MAMKLTSEGLHAQTETRVTPVTPGGGLVSAATQIENQTDRLHELAAEEARTEHAAKEAQAVYRAARAAEEAIETHGILASPTAAPTRALGAPGKPQGRKLTLEEREIELEEARDRRRAAGRAWREATEAALKARVARRDLLLGREIDAYEREADTAYGSWSACVDPRAGEHRLERCRRGKCAACPL